MRESDLSTSESYRQPLVHTTPRGWFFQDSPSRRYLLRELTAVPMGAYSIYLLVGLVAMSHGPAAWDAWLSFGRHPVGLFFALLCLAATLLHAITWFKLSASVFKMNFKGRPLPKILMVCFQAALAIVLFGALSIVFWQVWR